MYTTEDITNRIICGDALMELKRNKGKFMHGIHYSPETEFQKGQHWRKPKPYWNKDWLWEEYRKKKKSAKQIAEEQGCKQNNIIYFLAKLHIPIWTMKEIRTRKYWGSPGEVNGMFGKTGKLNPHWNGGHCPERQSKYARTEWKKLAKSILKRDDYKCQNCGTSQMYKNHLIVHHKKPWSRYPELRFEPSNLIVLCESCHKLVHKKRR